MPKTTTFYEVWCNGKPAVLSTPLWQKYQYDTWADAVQYVTYWVGEWSIFGDLEPDTKCYYTLGDGNGGDYVEIRKIVQHQHGAKAFPTPLL